MRLRAVLLFLLLAAVPAGAAGCGWGCSAELHVSPMTVRGDGSKSMTINLSARITDGGEPMEGVRIDFYVFDGSGGTIIGSATSGQDGAATAAVRNAVAHDELLSRHAEQWTKYQAKVSVIQSREGAGDAVCAEAASAPFRFIA